MQPNEDRHRVEVTVVYTTDPRRFGNIEREVVRDGLNPVERLASRSPLDPPLVVGGLGVDVIEAGVAVYRVRSGQAVVAVRSSS